MPLVSIFKPHIIISFSSKPEKLTKSKKSLHCLMPIVTSIRTEGDVQQAQWGGRRGRVVYGEDCIGDSRNSIIVPEH